MIRFEKLFRIWLRLIRFELLGLEGIDAVWKVGSVSFDLNFFAFNRLTQFENLLGWVLNWFSFKVGSDRFGLKFFIITNWSGLKTDWLGLKSFSGLIWFEKSVQINSVWTFSDWLGLKSGFGLILIEMLERNGGECQGLDLKQISEWRGPVGN